MYCEVQATWLLSKGVDPTCYLLSSFSIHSVTTLCNALPVAEKNSETGDCGGRERSK